eukprot:4703063-Amphidinium_carterae.1
MHADKDQNQRVVLIDRDHTQFNQRKELYEALQSVQWRTRGGRVLLVEFAHAHDRYGYGRNGQLTRMYTEPHVTVCHERIEGRGMAHSCRHPGPSMLQVLQRSAKVASPATPEEFTQFLDGHLCVEVIRTPEELALDVVHELRELKWSERLSSADIEDLTVKIGNAWQAYKKAEDWRRVPTSAADDPVRATQQPPNQPGRKRTAAQALEQSDAMDGVRETPNLDLVGKPLYYKLDFSESMEVLKHADMLPSH